MKNKSIRVSTYTLSFLLILLSLFSCFTQVKQPITTQEKVIVQEVELVALDTVIVVTEEELNNSKSGTIYTNPRFPGCENKDLDVKENERCAQTEMLKFIYGNLRYPTEARNNRIEGQAVIQFVITKEGYLANINLIRDLQGGCGQEALRVVRNMNFMPERWVPGTVDGEPRFLKFTLPVKFRLQG